MPLTPPSQAPSPAAQPTWDDTRSPPGTPPTAGPGAAAAPDDAHHATPTAPAAAAADGGTGGLPDPGTPLGRQRDTSPRENRAPFGTPDGTAAAPDDAHHATPTAPAAAAADGGTGGLPDPGTPLGTQCDTSPRENRAPFGTPDGASRADGAASSAVDSGPAVRPRTRLDFNPDGTGFQAASRADDLRVSSGDSPAGESEAALGISPLVLTPDTTLDVSTVVGSSSDVSSPTSGSDAAAEALSPPCAMEGGATKGAPFPRSARARAAAVQAPNAVVTTVSLPKPSTAGGPSLKSVTPVTSGLPLYAKGPSASRAAAASRHEHQGGAPDDHVLRPVAARATKAAPFPRTVDALHAHAAAQASNAAAAAATSPPNPSTPGGPLFDSVTSGRRLFAEEPSTMHQATPGSLRRRQDSVPDHLVCPVCCDVIVNATKTACRHRFCRLCLRRSLFRVPTCPLCRGTNVNPRPDYATEAAAAALVRPCEHPGCTFRGTRDVLAAHQRRWAHRPDIAAANERKRRREMGDLIAAVLHRVHPTRGWSRPQCEQLARAGCRVHALPSKAQHSRDGGRLGRAHLSTHGPIRLPATRLFVPGGAAAAAATGPFAVHLSHVEHQPSPSTVFVMRPGAPDTLQRVDVPASAAGAVPLTGMGWTAADAAKQLVVLVGSTPSDLGQAAPPA